MRGAKGIVLADVACHSEDSAEVVRALESIPAAYFQVARETARDPDDTTTARVSSVASDMLVKRGKCGGRGANAGRCPCDAIHSSEGHRRPSFRGGEILELENDRD